MKCQESIFWKNKKHIFKMLSDEILPRELNVDNSIVSNSRGVNMYAMLTGNLPFTVEPFNIKALHNKMVNSQMNPLPEGVTRGNFTNRPRQAKRCLQTCAKFADSGHPAHEQSIVRTFSLRSYIL